MIGTCNTLHSLKIDELAFAYVYFVTLSRVPHAKDPGYPAFLLHDYKEASEAASTALQLATLQASSLDAPTEQVSAE